MQIQYEENMQKIIGNNTIVTEDEKGNCNQLAKSRYRQSAIPTNARKRSPLGTEGKFEIKNHK